MAQSGIDMVIRRAIERYKDPNYEPPAALMDPPNTVVFPALQDDALAIPRGMGSPLGEFAMQMGEQMMGGQLGGMQGAPGGMQAPGGAGGMDMMSALMGGGMGADPMMGGVDAAQMMMQPGAPQGPAPGPLPEERMPIPGVS
jgi:hypothetical protein